MWCIASKQVKTGFILPKVSCAHSHIFDKQSELKRAVAKTRRGKKATIEQQKDILRQVVALEARSPTKDPARSPLLSGDWSLLYTGRAA